MTSEKDKDSVTTTSREDQENNMQRDFDMRKRKRADSDVAASTRKVQIRGNINYFTDPCNKVKEDVSVKKRRAGDDGEMPGKRLKRSNLSNPTEHRDVSVEDRKIQQGKRKASDDGEAPQKRIRSSSSSSSSSVLWIIVSSGSESCVIVEQDPSADDDDGDISHNVCGASAEEEKMFELSSSANTSRADFEGKYSQLAEIGKGGYGSVFDGIRKSDNLPVAIKYVPYEKVKFEKLTCNGKVFNVILEVAFMLRTAGLPGPVGQSTVVSLLDWYNLDKQLVLVMEKPSNSMDLFQYLQTRGGSLDEQEAKMILRQLVDAAIDMHSKGVFHRDIKPQNVLVQLDSGVPRVRVIDFGCSCFSMEMTYHYLCGTRAYFPPEWFDYQEYLARPTTVWQLGVLFYSLLSGHKPFTTMAFICNHIQFNTALSTEVKTLLHMCLNRDPLERATLEDLQRHPALRPPSPPPS